jgi:hypothetical protein
MTWIPFSAKPGYSGYQVNSVVDLELHMRWSHDDGKRRESESAKLLTVRARQLDDTFRA